MKTYSKSGVTGVVTGLKCVAVVLEIIRSAGTDTLRINSVVVGFKIRDLRCFLQYEKSNTPLLQFDTFTIFSWLFGLNFHTQIKMDLQVVERLWLAYLRQLQNNAK